MGYHIRVRFSLRKSPVGPVTFILWFWHISMGAPGGVPAQQCLRNPDCTSRAHRRVHYRQTLTAHVRRVLRAVVTAGSCHRPAGCRQFSLMDDVAIRHWTPGTLECQSCTGCRAAPSAQGAPSDVVQAPCLPKTFGRRLNLKLGIDQRTPSSRESFINSLFEPN